MKDLRKRFWKRGNGGLLLPVALPLMLVLLPACGGSTPQTVAASSEAALSTTHDASDSQELVGMLAPLANGPRDEGVEAWRCDPNPTITYVNVCGQQFPATIHFEWTACADNRGPAADHQPCMADGGMPPPMPPPPPFADGGLPPPPPLLPDGGMPPPPGPDFPQHGPDGSGMQSSGTVDVTNTVTDASGSCASGGEFSFSEQVTFSIARTDPRRGSQQIAGTTQSSSQHALGATQFTKMTQLDVHRTDADSDGGSDSGELSGTVSVAFDNSSGNPMRTINGQLSRTDPDGSTDQVTLNNVVREPPRICRTPTSGSLVYVAEDGSNHTLTFGPSCGAASLDGSSVDLDFGPPGPPPGAGPGQGPNGPGGPSASSGSSGPPSGQP